MAMQAAIRTDAAPGKPTGGIIDLPLSGPHLVGMATRTHRFPFHGGRLLAGT